MGLLDFLKGAKFEGPVFCETDNVDTRLSILEGLLDKVGDDQKEVVETQIKLITVGNSGENNVIYELKHSHEDMLILHDITIKDRVKDSQIDFILLTTRGIIVLETKKFIGDIEIDNEGNFVRIFKNFEGKVYKKEGIKSPITQNKYHIDALELLLKDFKLPKGFPFYSLIVIANSKTIVNKKFATRDIKEKIVKYDQLNDVISSLLNSNTISISQSKVINIKNYIIDHDVPREYDYVQQLGLKLKEEKIVVNDSKVEVEVEEKSDDYLYEALRKYRLTKSKELNLKPYFIFNNETLSELCLKKPTSKEELLEISNFGPKKVEQYGDDIINIMLSDSLNNGMLEDITEDESKLEEVDLDDNDKSITKPDVNADLVELEKTSLYIELREYRLNKSKELKLKPYMIFNNETLIELCINKPTTVEELLEISNIGPKKVEQYGKDILNIIKNN